MGSDPDQSNLWEAGLGRQTQVQGLRLLHPRVVKIKLGEGVNLWAKA